MQAGANSSLPAPRPVRQCRTSPPRRFLLGPDDGAEKRPDAKAGKADSETRLHRPSARGAQPLEHRTLGAVAATGAEACRRGPVRSLHGGSVPPRYEISALASGQGASAMLDAAGRGRQRFPAAATHRALTLLVAEKAGSAHIFRRMPYAFHTVDVFTDHLHGGNPLAVVPDARGLTDDQMQMIAKEFNYSETVFVFPPRETAHTRSVRIFTPGRELPFAGHPTVGCAFVLATIGEVPLNGEEQRIVLEEGVGPIPVSIRARNGKPVFAQLTAAKL